MWAHTRRYQGRQDNTPILPICSCLIPSITAQKRTQVLFIVCVGCVYINLSIQTARTFSCCFKYSLVFPIKRYLRQFQWDDVSNSSTYTKRSNLSWATDKSLSSTKKGPWPKVVGGKLLQALRCYELPSPPPVLRADQWLQVLPTGEKQTEEKPVSKHSLQQKACDCSRMKATVSLEGQWSQQAHGCTTHLQKEANGPHVRILHSLSYRPTWIQKSMKR